MGTADCTKTDLPAHKAEDSVLCGAASENDPSMVNEGDDDIALSDRLIESFCG